MVEEEISGVKWKTIREGWNVEGGVECVRVYIGPIRMVEGGGEKEGGSAR